MQIRSNPKKAGFGKTVLVVDDNPTIRELLAEAFLSDGFEICGQAENGAQGIEVAKQLQPDLITLDLSMPVMNGLEAATALRKISPNTPIILFTLHGNSPLATDAYKAGVSLVLQKTESLSTLVNKALELVGSSEKYTS